MRPGPIRDCAAENRLLPVGTTTVAVPPENILKKTRHFRKVGSLSRPALRRATPIYSAVRAVTKSHALWLMCGNGTCHLVTSHSFVRPAGSQCFVRKPAHGGDRVFGLVLAHEAERDRVRLTKRRVAVAGVVSGVEAVGVDGQLLADPLVMRSGGEAGPRRSSVVPIVPASRERAVPRLSAFTIRRGATP